MPDIGSIEVDGERPPLREQLLWQAVLHQAFKDLRGRDTTTKDGKHEAQQVRAWIGSQDFYTICNLAGLEPTVMVAAFEAGMEAMT